MRRIYICGPMRGRPGDNHDAFNRAAERFRALGWTVLNPVEIGEEMHKNDPTVPDSEYLRADVVALATCDAIALLPEWDHSVGARCEVGNAITFGLRFFDAGSATETEPPKRVTILSGGYDRPPGPVLTLDGLVEEGVAWANATFGHATNQSRANHLVKEALELQQEPDNMEECADVFLLLGHIAQGPERLAAAVRDKLAKNKLRKWGPVQANGIVEHVEEAAR